MITTSHPASKTNYRFDIRSALQRSFALNPLLTLVASAMILTLVESLIGIVVDPRIITGVPAWVKPAKFAISISIYCFTLLWLLSFIQGHKRLVSLVANVTALGFVVETVFIIVQVIRGTTSHFNVSTPFDATVYGIMGAGIVFIWLVAFIVAILLFMQRGLDPVFAWSLRLGTLLALVGMAVAFLMTQPTAIQMAAIHAGAPRTVIGAHSVGVVDGGPGLPFLGWSTVGGDLRIPHFVGLHALQVLPFLGWLLTLSFFSWLSVGHRVALVWTAATSYLGLIALLTWQALRAQSIIAPDALTLRAFAVWLGLSALSVIAILIHARMRTAPVSQH